MFLKLLLLFFFIQSLSIILSTRAQEPSCNSEPVSGGGVSCPATAIPSASPLNISSSEMFFIRLVPKSLPNLPSNSSMGQERPLNNMCAPNSTGFTFLEDQLTDCINRSTCPLYRKISNSCSSLGICEEVFDSLGFDVCLIPYNGSANITLYNASSLLDTVSKIEANLKVYFRVLDRTVVGSYFKEPVYRCLCLVSECKTIGSEGNQ